jgi:hypothetical protein
MQSKWVQVELNAALTGQLSGTGTAVLPVLIEDIEIPVLLRDHLYADFRTSYQDGLNMLLRAFRQEAPDPLSRLRTDPTPMATTNPCVLTLDALNKADLRRRIKKKLQRDEIAVIWFDTLFSRMDNDLPQSGIDQCIIELIERAVQRGLTVNLLEALCHNRPDVANA